MEVEDGIDPSPLIVDEDGHNLSPDSQRDNPSVSLNGVQTSPDGDATFSWRLQPLRSTTAYFSLLSSIFSRKFLSWLAISYFTLHGGIMTLLWLLPLPLFTDLGIGASRQQLYTTVIIRCVLSLHRLSS